jgi:serine/threonine-protein kinase RsbW
MSGEAPDGGTLMEDPGGMRDRDRIELTIPLKKQYARMVRLLVGAAASQCGFTVDRLEDAKLAAEEVFLLALGLAQEPSPATITLTARDGTLNMRMSGIVPGEGLDASPEARSWRYGLFVLNAIADEAHFSSDDGETVLELTISGRGGV